MLHFDQGEVQESIAAVKVDLTKWRRDKEQELGDIRAATEGGREAIGLMSKGPSETSTEHQHRQSRFRNIPICGFGAAAHAWLLYGEASRSSYWLTDQPIPDFISQVFARKQGKEVKSFEKSAEVNRWYRDVNDANHWGQYSVNAAFDRVRDGASVTKVFERKPQEGRDKGPENVAYARMPIEDVYKIPHKDNPDQVVAAAEARHNKGKVRWRLWTPFRWDWCDEKLQITEKGEEHAFGVVPFAWLGDGESLLRDAVLDQKELIHRESIRLIITNAQGFSLLEMKGQPIDNTPEDAGDSNFAGPLGYYSQGPSRVFWFKDGEGGINFASPDAPLEEHRAAANELMVNSMRVSLKLPGDLVSDAGGPEQPTSIQFHWLISLIQYSALVHEANKYQDQLTEITTSLAASGEFGIKKFDRDKLQHEHQFRANPLPHDKAAERELDRLDVASGLMLKEQYVHAWVRKVDDPEEFLAYMQALEQQAQIESAFLLPTPDGDGAEEPGDLADQPRTDLAEDSAIEEAPDLEAMSLLLERVLRAGDIELANVVRVEIAAALGKTVRPLSIQDVKKAQPDASNKGGPTEGNSKAAAVA